MANVSNNETAAYHMQAIDVCRKLGGFSKESLKKNHIVARRCYA